jgi:hypothetical protein
LHADDAARATADELAEPKDPKVQAIDKHVRITQRYCRVYGFTPECPRCTDLEMVVSKHQNITAVNAD